MYLKRKDPLDAAHLRSRKKTINNKTIKFRRSKETKLYIIFRIYIFSFVVFFYSSFSILICMSSFVRSDDVVDGEGDTL